MRRLGESCAAFLFGCQHPISWIISHRYSGLTLVASVIEVDKVLLEVRVERASINSVTVVLAGDVALTRRQVQSRNIVSTVAVLHLDSASTSSQGHKLVTQADSHDWDRRLVHQATQVVDRVHAVSWVTGAVGDEDTVNLAGNLVDWVVVRQDRDRCSSADQAAQDVLLDATVDQGNVEGRVGRRDHEGGLGAHPLDQVDLARVDKALVLVGIVLVANRDPGQRRTLLSEVGDNGTSVNARDGGHSLPSTPIAQTLDGGPVAVLGGHIGHNDSSTLDVGRLKVLEQVEFVADVRRYTVVSNERLSEDEDLATVGRIGHGLWVPDQGGGEDGLSRDVGVGTESSSVEHWAILARGESAPETGHHERQEHAYPDSQGSVQVLDRSSGPRPLVGHLPSFAAGGEGLFARESGLARKGAASEGHACGTGGRGLSGGDEDAREHVVVMSR